MSRKDLSVRRLGKWRNPLVGALALVLAAGWSLAPAMADPPPWAPAHGYRAKQASKQRHFHHEHYRDRVYIAPIGVDLGRCNREAVGALLGGVVGAAAGSTVGKGDERVMATIGGAIIGVLAGSAIGRGMDRADGYCVAQTLAHVDDGDTVIWRNPETSSEYHVTPMRSYSNPGGQYCREYTAAATIGGRHQTIFGTACLRPDGTWQLIS